MAVKPVTWVPWAQARSDMFKICARWSWDSNDADKAFVNVLRLRKVSYKGEAREIGGSRVAQFHRRPGLARRNTTG